jgi:hypothetical protein
VYIIKQGVKYIWLLVKCRGKDIWFVRVGTICVDHGTGVSNTVGTFVLGTDISQMLLNNNLSVSGLHV